MVVAAAAPLTVVAGASINLMLSNGPGIAFAYGVGTLIMLLFVVGFTAMTRHVKKPGAFYSYVSAGISRPVGVGAAFVAMLTYVCIQIAVYAYMGFVLSDLVGTWTGGATAWIPWWGYVLVGIALTAFFSYRSIDLSAKVLAVALVIEAGLVLVVNAAVIFSGGGPEGLSAASWLATENIFTSTLGLAVMFGVGVFMGIEATAIYRDEAKNPDRTIPRATYVAVIGTGAFYVFALWSLIQAWGANGLLSAAEANPGDLFLVTATAFVGKVFADIVGIFLIISMFACVLSLQNVIARYMHSLGNAGLLPARLGHVHAQHKSPHVAAVVTSAVTLAAVAVWAVLGLDPALQIFPWHIAVGTISIMVLFVITSIAVIRFFRKTKADSRAWNTLVAPALAAILLVIILIQTYANFDLLAGEAPVAITLFLQLLPFIALAAGLATALRMKSRRRAEYEKLNID